MTQEEINIRIDELAQVLIHLEDVGGASIREIIEERIKDLEQG